LQQTSEFADLSDCAGFNTSVFEEAANSFVGSDEFVLRKLAVGDFLLLVILGQSETDREGE
jgi:hypothetical protein